MSIQTAEHIIAFYHLRHHPEGGWYKETYRSAESIPQQALPARFTGDRSFSTAIYFLLEQGNFSAFHRIKSDECWHFYTGGTLLIYIIHHDGSLQITRLGNGMMNEEAFQFVVSAGCWFASVPAGDTQFSFVGCTVSPGFDFVDFEMAERQALVAQYPQHAAIINKLTRI